MCILFFAAGYAKQSGHGVPTIVNKYGCDIFSFEDRMIKVSIPLAFDRDDVIARRNHTSHVDLTENQKAVYEILLANRRKTLQDIADETELILAGIKKYA